MTFRFDDIGNRLKAFRLGSGLSADEIARRLDISRAALYRFEKGELAKIETLERLAELLGVSIATLLGVGVEYIASAVAYFERLRQIEQTAEHIVVLAGPISYLLASDSFDDKLAEVLRESVPEHLDDRGRALKEVDEIMAILHERKIAFRRRRPGIVNLVSSSEIARFLRDGLVARHGLPEKVRRERRAQARTEVAHLASILAAEPIGIQVGIVPDTLPHTGFQIHRQPDRELLSISPFRLGGQPNVRVGVVMITAAPEALALHQKSVEEMWSRALKGAAAARFLRELLAGGEKGAPLSIVSPPPKSLEKP
jgi:transcriptional regulator with XRE-family HTH domain